MTKLTRNIAVVGGGIAGLAAAYSLRQSTKVTLFESSGRLGGALQTTNIDGYRVEHSADMFVAQPNDAVQFCRQLGIEDQLITPNKTNRFSSIVQRNQLIRIPTGFSLMLPNQVPAVLKSPLLSAQGKMRFLMECFCQPQNNDQDESLKAFAVRHYGPEVFQRMIQPLVAGIYSANAEELSMRATLQRFVDMEEKHGSLIKAASANRTKEVEQQSSGARYGMFLTLKNGFGSLVDTLVRRLSDVDIRLNAAVSAISMDNEQRWLIGCGPVQESFDGVVLATSARVAANQLAGFDSEISQTLQTISFGSMIVVTIQCDESHFANQPPKGFGFVVPEVENKRLIACSFSSNKFAGRAPEGRFLLRAFLGGRRVNEALAMADDQIQQTVVSELGDTIGFKHNDRASYQVIRWEKCMPQYRVGHLDMIDRLGQQIQRHRGLALAGCSYKGVGIPACIQSGQDAAGHVLSNLEVEPSAG